MIRTAVKFISVAVLAAGATACLDEGSLKPDQDDG